MSGVSGAAVACCVALGVAVVSAVWFVSSWDEDERAWVASRVRWGCAAVVQAVRGIVSKAAHPGAGADARDDAVSLGEVSEMIDVVRLGLSAGLSFDASLELYCAQRSGTLAQRLSQAMLAWRVGAGTREEALARVAQAVGVKALESFALAVSQALALGAPLTDVLAAQSREIRASHRAEVERQIEQAPVKLLIPTGTLILPALLLSILGPLLAASGVV